MVGYATIYTMAPVFSLVLDRDVNEDLALLYPELYKELTKVMFFFVFPPPLPIFLCFGGLIMKTTTRAGHYHTRHSFNG